MTVKQIQLLQRDLQAGITASGKVLLDIPHRKHNHQYNAFRIRCNACYGPRAARPASFPIADLMPALVQEGEAVAPCA